MGASRTNALERMAQIELLSVQIRNEDQKKTIELDLKLNVSSGTSCRSLSIVLIKEGQKGK
jgi:hypothetical protein